MLQRQTNPLLPPSLGHRAKSVAKAVETAVAQKLVSPATARLCRLKRWSPRQPRMLGAYSDRETALANIPSRWLSTYDHAEVASVNFEWMCALQSWDYPAIFWLDKLSSPGMNILDAGGHFGTKYIAFKRHIRLEQLTWTIYDLTETIRTARFAQRQGDVPQSINFIDDLSDAPAVDLLFASGLLQYLDIPFPQFVAQLTNRPKHILLNKVATREGPSVVTLERIGPARVPYQIRCRQDFEAQIAAMNYVIADSWDIPSLGHVINTHPELGRSVSRGYLLHRRD